MKEREELRERIERLRKLTRYLEEPTRALVLAELDDLEAMLNRTPHEERAG